MASTLIRNRDTLSHVTDKVFKNERKSENLSITVSNKNLEY